MNSIALLTALIALSISSCEKEGKLDNDGNGNEIVKNNLIFYDDCESNDKVPLENQATNDWYKNSHGNVLGNKLGYSTEQARTGKGSYKFYLQPYKQAEDWVSDCELAIKGSSPNFVPGVEYWMGFSVFVPADQRWPDSNIHPEGGGGEWVAIWQYHGSGNPCDISGINPVEGSFLVPLSEGKVGYGIAINGDTRECLPDRSYERKARYQCSFSPGEWHDYVVNVKFSPKSSDNPFFKIWQDSVLVVDDKGINMYNLTSGMGPYFVFGTYGHMTTSVTTYFDEIRVGNENSSYDEVKPGASTK